MEKLKENWNKKLWYEKIIFIIGMASAVSAVILALLQFLEVWADAIYVYMPLTAVYLLENAFENRKRSRTLTISTLGVVAFITVVWILILFGL